MSIILLSWKGYTHTLTQACLCFPFVGCEILITVSCQPDKERMQGMKPLYATRKPASHRHVHSHKRISDRFFTTHTLHSLSVSLAQASVSVWVPAVGGIIAIEGWSSRATWSLTCYNKPDESKFIYYFLHCTPIQQCLVKSKPLLRFHGATFVSLTLWQTTEYMRK